MGLTQKLGTLPLAILTDASNNVGIGGSPSGSYKLEVTGGGRFSGTGYFGGATTASGISGGAELIVQNEIAIQNNDTAGPILRLIAGSLNGPVTIQTDAFTGTQPNLNFIVGGSQRLSIASSTGLATFSGSVTAGDQIRITGTTANALYLYGAATVKPYITINEFGVRDWKIGAGSTTTNFLSITSTLGGTDGILIYGPNGNVLIGSSTNNGERLQVNGGITFTSYLLTTAGYIGIGNQIQGGWTSTDMLLLNNNNGGKIAFNTTNGSAYNGVYLVSGATSFSPITSDIRTKKNFETTQGLTEVLQIEPTKYHLITDDNNSVKRLGFKAQNLQPLIPEMVIATGNKANDGSDYLTIVPDYLLPVLVKAIQELSAQNQDLKSRLDKAGL